MPVKAAARLPKVSTANQVPEFNDMEFPELDAKADGVARRAGGKGKWNATDRTIRREAAVRGTLTKKVTAGNDAPLSKKRHARLNSASGDGLATDVPYSLNRKARWMTAAPSELLDDDFPECAEVTVVEAVKARGKKNLATAVHHLSINGEMSTAKAARCTAHTATLKLNAAKKRREAKTRNSKNSDTTIEDLPSDSEDVAASLQIQYTIEKSHANPRASSKKAVKDGCKDSKATRRARDVKICEDDVVLDCEMQRSVNSDEFRDFYDFYQPSKYARFCLGDFIQKTAPMEIVRRPASSSKDEGPVIRAVAGPRAAPCPIASLAEFRDAGFHDEYTPSYALRSGFEAEMRAVLDAVDSHIWLDADRTRLVCDVEQRIRSAQPSQGLHSKTLLVFEKLRENKFRVRVNSVLRPITGLNDLWPAFEKAGQLKASIDAIVTVLTTWQQPKNRTYTQPLTSVSEFFQPKATPLKNICTFTPIGHQQMAEIIREESKQYTAETFERLSTGEYQALEEFEYDCGFDEPPATNTVAATPSKPDRMCNNCKVRDEVLYELDYDWECHKCIRREIVHRLHLKLPLDIKFVCPEGTTSFDQLSTFIPLPLIHFYLEYAAVKILQDNGSIVGQTLNCPGCQTVAYMEAPCVMGIVQCARCKTTFCKECFKDPHYPLSCGQYAQFKDAFDAQYELAQMPFDKGFYEIVCDCSTTIRVSDMMGSAKCFYCQLEFNPATMEILTGYPCTKPPKLPHKSKKMVQPQVFIGKSLYDVAMAGFVLRKRSPLAKPTKKAESQEFDLALRRAGYFMYIMAGFCFVERRTTQTLFKKLQVQAGRVKAAEAENANSDVLKKQTRVLEAGNEELLAEMREILLVEHPDAAETWPTFFEGQF